MAHLLEWPKSRTLTIPSTGKGVEQQELSFIAGGNAEWYSCLGRQLGISLQNQPHSRHIIQKLCQLCIYPNELKTYALTKNLYTDVCNSFIYPTSEIQRVQLQVTAIRWLLQESKSHTFFFWFPGTYRSYVYTAL